MPTCAINVLTSDICGFVEFGEIVSASVCRGSDLIRDFFIQAQTADTTVRFAEVPVTINR